MKHLFSILLGLFFSIQAVQAKPLWNKMPYSELAKEVNSLLLQQRDLMNKRELAEGEEKIRQSFILASVQNNLQDIWRQVFVPPKNPWPAKRVFSAAVGGIAFSAGLLGLHEGLTRNIIENSPSSGMLLGSLLLMTASGYSVIRNWYKANTEYWYWLADRREFFLEFDRVNGLSDTSVWDAAMVESRLKELQKQIFGEVKAEGCNLVVGA